MTITQFLIVLTLIFLVFSTYTMLNEYNSKSRIELSNARNKVELIVKDFDYVDKNIDLIESIKQYLSTDNLATIKSQLENYVNTLENLQYVSKNIVTYKFCSKILKLEELIEIDNIISQLENINNVKIFVFRLVQKDLHNKSDVIVVDSCTFTYNELITLNKRKTY